MATISLGATVLYPALQTEWSTTQDSGNIVRRIIGRSAPDVAYGNTSLRTGTFKTYWFSEAEAEACRVLHTQNGVFAYTEDALPTTNMLYVPSGDITMSLDFATDSVKVWTVEVEFQEVTL